VKKDFLLGLRDGIPISLGYLSVSFGFGILAAGLGLSVAEAVAISALNLTSAGQVAGVGIIAAAGSLMEMALTQLVINIRYSLMALSLSQKLTPGFTTPHRLLASVGITDEIFAMSYSKEGRVSPYYMYGLIAIAFIGWTGGTFLGAAAGEILPAALTDAMGIMLYGMFIAIVVPELKKQRQLLAVIAVAVAVSSLFYYVFTSVSGGFSVIISAVAAAAFGALLFPVDEEAEE